jgi:hypothetical protein
MVELSEKKKGIEELLEKIPPETCWAITAKILSSLFVLRGDKTTAPILGTGEGVTAPILGAEKWKEIVVKAYSEGVPEGIAWVKETFNIPVENAIDADNLMTVASRLELGPEWEHEYIERTPERVVCILTKCPYWERYKEFNVDPAFIFCDDGHKAICKLAFKRINPKITYKLTKAMPWGDPYCEEVYEFKEE